MLEHSLDKDGFMVVLPKRSRNGLLCGPWNKGPSMDSGFGPVFETDPGLAAAGLNHSRKK
jgi:hypothetical protein